MSGQGSSSSRKPSARSVKSPPQPSSTTLAMAKGSGTGRLSSRAVQASKPATTPSGITSPVGRSSASGAGAGAGAGVGGSSKPSSSMASPAGTTRSRQSPVGTARTSQATGRSSIASPVGTSRSGYVASPVSTSRSRQSPENTARSGKDSAREVANRAIRSGARAGQASPSVTPRSARGVAAGQAQQQQQQHGEPLLPPAAQRRGSTLASARKPPPGGPQKMKRSSIVGDIVAPPVRQPVPKPHVPKIVLSMHGNANCAERRIARALILIEETDPYQKCTGALEIQECLPQWRGRYSECVNGLVRLVSDKERKVREAAAGALVSTCDRGDPTVVSAMHEHLQAKLEAPTLACPPPPKDAGGIDSKQTSEQATAVKPGGSSRTLGAGSSRTGASGKGDEAKNGRVRDRGKGDSTSPTSRRDASSLARGNASNTARSNASNTARSNASNTARSNASNTARSNASNTASNTGRSGASSGRSGVDEVSHHRSQGGGRNAPTPTPREGARQMGVGADSKMGGGADSKMGGAGGRASTPTSQKSASPGRSPQATSRSPQATSRSPQATSRSPQATSRSPSQSSVHSPDSKEGTPRSQEGTPRSRASGGSVAGSKQSSPISSPGRSTGNDSHRSTGGGTNRFGGPGGGTGRSSASASSVVNPRRQARSTPVGTPRAAGGTPRAGDKGSVEGGRISPSGSAKKADNGAGLNSSIESTKSHELIKSQTAADDRTGAAAGVDAVAVDDATGVGGGIQEALQLEAISVIEKVAHVGDEESLNILGTMVQSRAVQAIRELLPHDNDEMLERVAQHVAVHFNNVRPEVRSSSLRAVGVIGKRGHHVILQLVMRLLIDPERSVREEAMRACLMLCDESQKGAAVAAIAETMVDSVGGGSIRMRRRALHALGQLSDANNEGEDGAGVMKEFQHSTAGSSNFEVHVPLEGDAIEEDALERIGVPPEKSTHLWGGLSRVPYSISGCFGPIGGVVYIRCNSRIWTYDISSMRVGHVQHEAYWDVWGGSVKHGNVRFSHLVPDMANPAYSCSIGPIFRDGAWKVIFIYADSGMCLSAPIMMDKALSGGCPFRSATAEVTPLSSLFPSISNTGGGQQSRQSQRGNTSPMSHLDDDRFAPFTKPDCASGEWMHDGVPVFMSFAEGQVCYFTPDPSYPGGYMPLKGPFVVCDHFEGVSRNHIEAVWGPAEVMEHVEGGRWRSRMVVMLMSSKSAFEVDILTRKCHKRERSHLEVDPFDIASAGGEWTRAQDGLAYTLPETPRIRSSTSNATSRAASSEAISREASVESFGSRPVSRASASNETSGEGSFEEGDDEGSDQGSEDAASSTDPPAHRPWNLVTVNKPPRRIKLGGFLPHCGEVCGEYAIVEEVWSSTDRPLYVQVTSDKEASHKSMQAAKGSNSGAGLNSTLLMSMASGRTSSMNRTTSSSSAASIAAAGIEGGGAGADRVITSPLPAVSPSIGPALQMRSGPGHEASGIATATSPSLRSQSQELTSGASPQVGVNRHFGSRLASPESASSAGTGPLQSMSQLRFLGSRPGSQESIQSGGAFDSNAGDYEWNPMFLYWVWQGDGLVDEDASGYWVVGDQPGETDGGMMCESDAGNPIGCLSPWQFWDGKKWTVAPESFKLSVPDPNKQNLASDADQARQTALASMAPNLRSTLKSTIATSSSHMTYGTGGIEAKRAGVSGHHAKYDHYVLQELSEELGSGSESGLPEGGSRRGSFKLSPRSMARRYSQLKEKRSQELSDQRSKAESALLAIYKDNQDAKYGWIWKLNSNVEGNDIKDWRDRLVILDNAVMSYISEKQEGQLVKICDIRNVKKISEVNYSLPGCSAALALTFLDESSITFGMKTGKERMEWNKAMRLQMSDDNDKLAEAAE